MKKVFYTAVQILALIVFVALIPLLFLYEEATSLVWTIIIPVLPLVIIIIGFSNWRNICPLAYFSKISQNIELFEKRKVPSWFENNFYNFQYFLLFSAFTLRLTILNFNSTYLAVFFIIIVLSAFIINLIYTGKSWCNFFCPVGIVEKIYCISNSKNYMENSACSTCTACKKNCPDIDMESNYWREGVNKQKSFVFYSFPGLILGFYIYFYLQSGTLDYYFSGSWTGNDFSVLSNGFFFASFIPVLIAAPITLSIFSLFSFYPFNGIEQYLWKKRVLKNANYETTVHRVKVVASFIAFNIFYIFAGAPSYQHYPVAYGVFYFIVVAISSALLYKEIFREQSYFIQERFALKIVKNWKSDKPIPGNLKEIYYTYVNENKDKKDKLNTYTNTIKDLMQEGILNEGSVIILEKLREQIGISEKEHFYTMRSLKLTHEDLFDETIEKSTEKKYQRSSYKKMIEDALIEHFELDSTYIKSLRKQFGITDEVHKSIMDSILNTNEKFHADVLNLLTELYQLLKIKNTLLNDNTREIAFLKYALKNEFNLLLKDLFSLLFILYKDHKDTLKILMDIAKEKQVDSSFELNSKILDFMDNEIATKILLLKENFDIEEKNIGEKSNKELISNLLSHNVLEIAIAALLVLIQRGESYLPDANLSKFTFSVDENVHSLINKFQNKTDDITTYEKMMYLSSVSMFKNIKYQDLKILAHSTDVISFVQDEYIIKKDTVGNKLFIIIKGEAVAEINETQTAPLSDTDYFGEIALLGDVKRTASVKAVTPLLTLTVTKQEFKKFIYENPEVSTLVMKEIINKLVDKQA